MQDLLGGGTLPAGGLCGRTFVVQFAAGNAAGFSAVSTSTASYTMPACPGAVATAAAAAAAEGVSPNKLLG